MREHPIRRWCRRKKKTQVELARLAGISPQYVCDIIAGRTRCGRDGGLAIVKATGGEITLAEILTWEPADPRPAA
jgi:DNA-binding transcriptional regulator YdaS (Cro superfamily)